MEFNHSQAYNVLTEQMDIVNEALVNADKNLDYCKQARRERDVEYFLGLRTGYSNAWCTLLNARNGLEE